MKPKNPSPWGSPRSAPRSERGERQDRPERAERSPYSERGERLSRPERAERAPYAEHGERAPRKPYAERGERHEREGRVERSAAPRPESNRNELRVHGMNAVLAIFAKRPESIRKVYLSQGKLGELRELLAWCVANRVGYRVVEEADLSKLAASAHHEGVVADILKTEPLTLADWLRELPEGPQLALWLDGVGNPHNFGAILRSAAHFGVSAVLLPAHSKLALSGAAARVAEGGAESVALVRLPETPAALAELARAGFTTAATVVAGGESLFAQPLPPRLVYVMGAEGQGMDRMLAADCDLQLSIPGTGAVESLNVASATTVFLAEWARSQR